MGHWNSRKCLEAANYYIRNPNNVEQEIIPLGQERGGRFFVVFSPQPMYEKTEIIEVITFLLRRSF